MTATKPTALRVLVEPIPEALRFFDQWVNWRYEWKKERWAKVPLCPRTGAPASVSDRHTWGPFFEAHDRYLRGGVDGVGFVLTAEASVTGIDLDRCRDPRTGVVEPWADALVRELGSYAEVSPSGTGVKAFVRGTLKDRRGGKKGQVELYSEGRYFTVTGRRLEGVPAEVRQEQGLLRLLEERFLGAPTDGPTEDPDVTPMAGLTDEQVIDLATKRNGEKFARLWSGDVSGYPSASEADLALLAILGYWTRRDPARMERLFGESGLGKREKWARADYRQKTIRQALVGMVTRRTTSIQEQSGTSKTEHRCPAKAAEQPSEGQLPPGGGEEEAVGLAEAQVGAPSWQASFALARRLRKLADSRPERFEEAVRAFCRASGHDFEELWYAFLSCWDKVRLAEGDDVLTWALNAAKERPSRPSPLLGETYGLVASIAFHLADQAGKEPFWLPRERLAGLLSCSPMTVSRIITLLEKNKVIECVRAEYSFTEGRAKEYRFVGGQGGKSCSPGQEG
jgi:hypothetical protein